MVSTFMGMIVTFLLFKAVNHDGGFQILYKLCIPGINHSCSYPFYILLDLAYEYFVWEFLQLYSRSGMIQSWAGPTSPFLPGCGKHFEVSVKVAGVFLILASLAQSSCQNLNQPLDHLCLSRQILLGRCEWDHVSRFLYSPGLWPGKSLILC